MAAGVLTLGGCATAGARPIAAAGFAPRPLVPPIEARMERVFNITVCLRPFRSAGPRLDTEHVGETLVVHNYGHGGSGWSLAWGSGAVAVRQAMARGAREIAVVGAGALGLTAAVLAQRAGAKVTLYARDLIHETRSARATGTWSPDSRIALTRAAAPEFPALWEEMCRASYKAHLAYLGLADAPVEWTDRYTLSDGEGAPHLDPIGFAQYRSRIPDLHPRSVALEPDEHPFPVARARRGPSLTFNITALGHLLMREFVQAGGRIERREFHTPAEFGQLPEKVAINCTGYGARALWKDETLVPVRGQIAWLTPQPEANYGLYFDNVSLLARRDGIVVQALGPDESWGYGDDNETPDLAEAEAAVRTMARLFPKAPSRAG